MVINIFGVVLVAFIAIIVFSERKIYEVHNLGIVLITGASTGIGRAAAEHIAENYNFLVLAGVRKESDLRNIENLNMKNLVPFMVDVSSHVSCSEAVNNIEKIAKEKNLPFVALINNAGIGRFGPIEFQDLDDAKTLFDTNVFGLLDLTQQLIPLLRESKGRVIMVSSVSGITSSPFSGIYAASKFAVEAISDALRRELRAYGVSVSVVQPGYVSTQIIASSRKATDISFKEQASDLLNIYPTAAKRAGMEEMMAQQPGPDVTTTPAIAHALTSAHPKTRYLVAGAFGIHATAISWLVWALSDRLEDLMF